MLKKIKEISTVNNIVAVKANKHSHSLSTFFLTLFNFFNTVEDH